MQPMGNSGEQQRVQAAHMKLVIIWFAMLGSIGLFIFLTRTAGPSVNPSSESQETHGLILIACGLAGISTFLLSFALKKVLMKRAVERRDLNLAGSATVLAVALCEATCLFGYVGYFITGNVYAYLLFALSVLGLLLHFPRKAGLLGAAAAPSGSGM